MAGLEEKLCPVCFQEAMEHGECRNCGYHAEESSAAKDYLAPFTILKEKYLLGKSLGQGGFGITYLAENMQSGLRCCIKEYFPSGLLQGRTPDGALILADTQKPCQGPWTDIYALAATFYFIVSGRKMLDALSRAKGASYPPLHELCPAVSRQLSDVIDKALAFDYHDRYRRMLDFLDALEQVVRPEDYDIDLGALMPKSKASKQAEIHVETSDDSEKMCQVEEQNMPEPKGLAAFFHPKKRRLAYLELTMRKSGGHISRRRWIIEPNRTVKVGRLATSDVMMPADNQISRNHCEVFYNEPKREFIVRDLSKYGTYLADGKPMEKEKSYTLKDGDIFCVVSPEYTFKVVIET